MAEVCKLYLRILTALALCKYCAAQWNSTDVQANRTVSHCHLHGDQDNCTDTERWEGHFSKCPEDLEYFCIHGDCRYIKEQKTPSCKCQSGYFGQRCQYVDFDKLVGEKRRIIIISCVSALLLLLIIIVVCICLSSNRKCRPCWWKRRRREEPTNGMEKLSMMEAGAARASSTTETSNIDSV